MNKMISKKTRDIFETTIDEIINEAYGKGFDAGQSISRVGFDIQGELGKKNSGHITITITDDNRYVSRKFSKLLINLHLSKQLIIDQFEQLWNDHGHNFLDSNGED
jgi:F0F1-type ATP synthase alpha subunit